MASLRPPFMAESKAISHLFKTSCVTLLQSYLITLSASLKRSLGLFLRPPLLGTLEFAMAGLLSQLR